MFGSEMLRKKEGDHTIATVTAAGISRAVTTRQVDSLRWAIS